MLDMIWNTTIKISFWPREGSENYYWTIEKSKLKSFDKCPNTEFFLVRIWARFTQCNLIYTVLVNEFVYKFNYV